MIIEHNFLSSGGALPDLRLVRPAFFFEGGTDFSGDVNLQLGGSGVWNLADEY